MALASGFTSNAFSMAAGHIPLVIPDPITVGALSAIVDSFAFGTPVAKLQASNTGLADPFAFGTQIAKLQASNSGLSDPFGRPDLARTLERELQLHSKGQNSKNLSKLKDGKEMNEPEIVPLKEAYLSFNQWCDQFEEVHLDLQEFVDGPLKVTGSHQISFQQFSHRILKKALETKELQHLLESFSRLRSGGVDKNLEEKFIYKGSSDINNDS